MIFFGLVFIIIGIIQAAYPKEAYMFGKRWQFKGDVEPSDIMITLTRFGGIVLVLVGIGIVIGLFR